MNKFNSISEVVALADGGGHVVIITRGASCSGKDTVAAAIAAEFGEDFRNFSTDDLIGETAEEYAANFSVPTLVAAHGENFRLFSERCMGIFYERAVNHEQRSLTAVANTGCSDWEVLGYINAANAYGATVVIVHCDATLETIKGRKNRAGAPDNVKERQHATLTDSLANPTFPPFIVAGMLTINTNG